MIEQLIEPEFISNNGIIRTLSQMRSLPISKYKVDMLEGLNVGEWFRIDCDRTEIDSVKRIK
jgi:hypothetical protein